MKLIKKNEDKLKDSLTNDCPQLSILKLFSNGYERQVSEPKKTLNHIINCKNCMRFIFYHKYQHQLQ